MSTDADEIFPHIERWRAESKGVALATVVQTWGSSPRPVGLWLYVSGRREDQTQRPEDSNWASTEAGSDGFTPWLASARTHSGFHKSLARTAGSGVRFRLARRT